MSAILSSRPDTNISLNVVRAVSASLVVMGHLRALLFVDFSAAESKGIATQIAYLLGSLGHPAVMVFFVLSGYWVGGGAIRAMGRGSFTWSGYSLARLSRLWLVLIPAILLTQILDRVGSAINSSSGVYTGDPAYHTVVPVGGPLQFLGLRETLGNIFFVQSLWVPPIGTDTPLWSLAYEFWFYAMFPAILLVFSRRHTTRFRVAAMLLLLLSVLIAGPRVLALFPIWGTGALLAWQRNRVGRWLDNLPSRVLVLMRSAAVCGAFGAAAASTYFAGRVPGSDYIVGATALAMVAVFVRDPPGAHRLYPISKAADWSYSLYAFHLPILALFTSFIVPQPEGRWQISPVSIGMGVLVLSATFLAAYVLSLGTEAQT